LAVQVSPARERIFHFRGIGGVMQLAAGVFCDEQLKVMTTLDNEKRRRV
jgi:hypothetical protein